MPEQSSSIGLSSIGFITDGNRRYAKKYGLNVEQAYRKGFEKAEEVFDWCLHVPGLNTATIYALSFENTQRSSEELEILFALYKEYLGQLTENKKIHENQVRVRVIGEQAQIAQLAPVIDKLHAATQNYDKFKAYIALGYSGRREILHAAKLAFSQNVGAAGVDKIPASQSSQRAGRIPASQLAQRAGRNPQDVLIDEQKFAEYLYQPADLDLLVRTGGAHRLSNFLPWQTAYSEFFFTEKLWPEFSKTDFAEALDFFKDTKRNFGH